MEFVESIARIAMPEWDEYAKLSVACISTTNPVYLVFHKCPLFPKLVVRVADSEEICRIHVITQELYKAVGDLIPEPVSITQYMSKQYAVQKGVKGTPWFQLSNKITKASQWFALRQRAITSLNQLHQGISKVDDWVGQCSPGHELRDSFKECVAAGTPVSQELILQVEAMSAQLDTLGAVPAISQHGDFCLNNLIIDDDTIHIIDFEDFGVTSMPLFDEISLALSIFHQAPKYVDVSLYDELERCTKEKAIRLGIKEEMLPAFLLHHLLLRLGKWSLGARRKGYREWLIATLVTFVFDQNEKAAIL